MRLQMTTSKKHASLAAYMLCVALFACDRTDVCQSECRHSSDVSDRAERDRSLRDTGNKIHLGLMSKCPSDTDSGVELSAGGYHRSAGISTDKLRWMLSPRAGASLSKYVNSESVEFSSPTEPWTVNCSGAYDAEVGGNLLFWVAITSAPVVIPASYGVAFKTGDYVLTPGTFAHRLIGAGVRAR